MSLAALAYARRWTEEHIDDPALRVTLLRALTIYANAHPDATFAEMGAWLDVLAANAVEVAYALRVEDHPRVAARVAEIMRNHEAPAAALKRVGP